MKTNEVLEDTKARRSARAYIDRQASEEDLQATLEAVTSVPSGMHLETRHLTATQNADKLAELNERIKGALAKSDEPKLQERDHSKAYCCYYHTPALAIVSNEPTQWWVGMDCACAIENMSLAAHPLGTGSCWINQLGMTCGDPEVRELISSLGVPENHKVYGCVALGYTDPKISLREKMVKAGTVTVVRQNQAMFSTNTEQNEEQHDNRKVSESLLMLIQFGAYWNTLGA